LGKPNAVLLSCRPDSDLDTAAPWSEFAPASHFALFPESAMPDAAKNDASSLSPTTRWSLIAAAGGEAASEEEARQALEQLCRIYWPPVLRFIRARGYSEADAKDLTQEFFLRFSEATFLQKARLRFGRFRALVFSALKHLLCDEADRRGALKRGGAFQILSLEDWMASTDGGDAPSDPATERASRMFDFEWAALVVRNALGRLQDDFAARGKARHFEALRGFLTVGESSPGCAEAAARLGQPLGTVRAMIHHMRGKYGGYLRDEVAQTVADPRDIDDEIRHLRGILATQHEISSTAAG
jgi:RNA polymerase sigma-70 factor (ECF subfamily)